MNNNFNIKLDLSKLNGFGLMDVMNNEGKQTKVVCIPVEENEIFIGEKGSVSIDFQAFELKEESKRVNGNFKTTHCIKKSYSKDKYNNLSEDAKKSIPIVGNVSIYLGESSERTQAVQYSQISQNTTQNQSIYQGAGTPAMSGNNPANAPRVANSIPSNTDLPF